MEENGKPDCHPRAICSVTINTHNIYSFTKCLVRASEPEVRPPETDQRECQRENKYK